MWGMENKIFLSPYVYVDRWIEQHVLLLMVSNRSTVLQIKSVVVFCTTVSSSCAFFTCSIFHFFCSPWKQNAKIKSWLLSLAPMTNQTFTQEMKKRTLIELFTNTPLDVKKIWKKSLYCMWGHKHHSSMDYRKGIIKIIWQYYIESVCKGDCHWMNFLFITFKCSRFCTPSLARLLQLSTSCWFQGWLLSLVPLAPVWCNMHFFLVFF